MSKNKKTMIISLLIVTIAFVFLSIYGVNTENKENHVNCTARIVYIQGKTTQHLTLSFMFNKFDSSGVAHIEGVQFTDGINRGFINRNVHFTYKNNEDYFILTSTEIRIIKGESINQDEIQQTFPAFYSTAKNKIIYTISKQKNNGYLFIIAGTPRFFCEK